MYFKVWRSHQNPELKFKLYFRFVMALGQEVSALVLLFLLLRDGETNGYSSNSRVCSGNQS